MIHVGMLFGCLMIKANNDFRPVVIIQHDSVFPTFLVRRRGSTFHLFDKE